jgi:serine/threonine-protein kinase RsbT
MATILCEVGVTGDADVAVLVSRARRSLEEAAVPGLEAARLVTVCAELGRNIAKYARYGVVRIELSATPRGRLVAVEAIDRGPGIADVDAALRDHVSTGGSLGLGLPGIQRMMDGLRVESRPGSGTRVRAERFLPHREHGR